MHHHRSKLPVLTDAHCTRMMRLCCYELIDMYGSWSGRGGGEGRGGVQEADRGGGRPGGPRAVPTLHNCALDPVVIYILSLLASRGQACCCDDVFTSLGSLSSFISSSSPRVHALQAATSRQNTCFHDPHSVMCVEYNSIKWKR